MTHRKTKRRSSTRRRRSHRRHGGSADVNLAYTGTKVPTQPNPFLSYTGPKTGGSSNPNGMNPLYPNTGPPNTGGPATPFLNPQNTQLGGQRGGCGCSNAMQTGGGCGCGSNPFKGGICPACSQQTGGNCGIPYPDGLVGNPVSPSAGPGYYYPINTYKNDISRDMQTSPPIVGGRRRSRRHRRGRRGGGFSNFLGQDLVNFGRGLQYSSGSTYNALMGYPAPVNPLPWKDQLPNKGIP